MPCHYKIIPSENLVAKSYWGLVTARCVLQMLDDIEDDALYQEGMAEFDDLSSVTDFAITPSEIDRFADLVTGLSNRKRRPTKKAVFAPSASVRDAANHFSKLVEGSNGVEVGVFENRSEALAFLGGTQGQVLDQSILQSFNIH